MNLFEFMDKHIIFSFFMLPIALSILGWTVVAVIAVLKGQSVKFIDMSGNKEQADGG